MKENGGKSGFITLIICGILTVLLIVGCLVFPEQIFGIFK